MQQRIFNWTELKKDARLTALTTNGMGCTTALEILYKGQHVDGRPIGAFPRKRKRIYLDALAHKRDILMLLGQPQKIGIRLDTDSPPTTAGSGCVVRTFTGNGAFNFWQDPSRFDPDIEKAIEQVLDIVAEHALVSTTFVCPRVYMWSTDKSQHLDFTQRFKRCLAERCSLLLPPMVEGVEVKPPRRSLFTDAERAELRAAQGRYWPPLFRLFSTAGPGEWLIASFERGDDDILCGIADIGMDCVEHGTMSLSELEEMRHPMLKGLYAVEKDRHFDRRRWKQVEMSYATSCTRMPPPPPLEEEIKAHGG